MYCYKCHKECNDVIEEENLVSDCCQDIVTFDLAGTEVATYGEYIEHLAEEHYDAQRENRMLDDYLEENPDA